MAVFKTATALFKTVMAVFKSATALFKTVMVTERQAEQQATKALRTRIKINTNCKVKPQRLHSYSFS
jgi:hypothetical protein